MAHAISKDAGEFTAQHPAFVAAPRAELVNAMAWAKASDELGGEYDRFIEDMVYAPTARVASYAHAALAFENMLELVLAAIPDRELAPPAKRSRVRSAQGPARS